MKLAYLLYALLMLSGLFSCVANEKTEMPVIPVDLENSRKKVSLSDITEEYRGQNQKYNFLFNGRNRIKH